MLEVLCWNWIRMTMYVTKLAAIPVSKEWLMVKYPFALKPWNFSNCNEIESVWPFDDWDLSIFVLMFDTSVANSSLSLQKNTNCNMIPNELPRFPINSGHSEKVSTTDWNECKCYKEPKYQSYLQLSNDPKYWRANYSCHFVQCIEKMFRFFHDIFNWFQLLNTSCPHYMHYT